MGARVLGVAPLGGDASTAPNVTVHAWCGASLYGLPPGSVTLAWVNANMVPVTLEQARREEGGEDRGLVLVMVAEATRTFRKM